MASALTLLRDEIVAVLSVADLSGVNVLLERSADEAIPEAMRPAIVPRMVDFTFSRDQQFGAAAISWSGVIDFDIFTDSTAFETVTERHTEIAGTIAALMNAAMENSASLGGMLEICDPKSLTGQQDAGPDVGGVTLTFDCRFTTPANNWSSIIGPAGTFT